MDVTPHSAQDDTPGPSNTKRKKRCSRDSPTDSEGSEPEIEEYELFTKYFVTNINKRKQKIQVHQTQEIQTDIKRPQKRKYHFKGEDAVPKKTGKYYFISKYMTKPRKLKAPQSCENNNKMQVWSTADKVNSTGVDKGGNLYLTNKAYSKSDLFFNDEKKCNYEALKRCDLGFNIVDEIALEGLDGITVEGNFLLNCAFPRDVTAKF